MMSIFREYDIRGIFQKELNFDVVSKIGYLLGLEMRRAGVCEVVSIGYDARIHSKTLFGWLCSGFNAASIEVWNNSLVPTPVNYFSNFIKFDGLSSGASVMITGSHNPPEYNGFKITLNRAPFFGEQIYRLGEDLLELDISIVENHKSKEIDALEKYIEYMSEEFKALKSQKGVVCDFGNGASGVALLPIFDRIGVEYKSLYEIPDGTFPNHHPDPSEEKNLVDLKNELSKEKIGFGFDGDGDRIALLTPSQNIKGDMIATIFAKRMKNPIVIGEVKCSQVMYDEINRVGKAIMYKTGHSNLKVKLKELNATFAAEVSGHLFFNDRYFGYDDAIYSALRILELRANGVDFDKEIEALPKLYSSEELKIETTEESKFEIIKTIEKILKDPPKSLPKVVEIITIDGLRIHFEDGWALVRASNTTPVLVTRFEASSKEMANLYKDEIGKIIKEANESL